MPHISTYFTRTNPKTLRVTGASARHRLFNHLTPSVPPDAFGRITPLFSHPQLFQPLDLAEFSKQLGN